MKKVFEGVGVAIVTPFKNGGVDYKSLDRLLKNMINDGADAIIVLGTTGEASTISTEERQKIIEFCRNIIPTEIKMITGTGNNNFETCCQNTKAAKEVGADAVLVVTPYYNKTTQHGLEAYYQKLAEIEIPIIMYNVPSRTGLNIEIETIEKIINTNQMVFGLKESTSDISRIQKLANVCRNKIALYSGEDDLNFLFYCLGADGTISVTANAYCREVKQIFEKVKSGSIDEAREKQRNLSEINQILFCETNPVPIKFLLKELGVISNSEVRMPLVQLLEKNQKRIKNIIKNK